MEERRGKSLYGQEAFRQDVGRDNSGAQRRAAESMYANDLLNQENRKKAETLRLRLDGVNQDIAQRNASIESIVTKMQEGERVARASRNKGAIDLHKQLQGELQAEKLALLAMKERHEKEKIQIEDELAKL